MSVDNPELFYSHDYAVPYTMRLGQKDPKIGCFRAERLGKLLGLEHLWILLSGWAPQWGSEFLSGSFKELEALGVLASVCEKTDKTLMVSSAGNAARAFLNVSLASGLPSVVIIPESAAGRMWTTPPQGKRRPLLLSLAGAAYPDAINMVSRLKDRFEDSLVTESGCYNVARRDSIGVLLHSFFHQTGMLPDHYFQAVGSATGVISAWEALSRIQPSLPSSKSIAMHLVQNRPFVPIWEAWSKEMDQVPAMTREEVRQKLRQTCASTLSNATPPYSTTGGIRDVLASSGGKVYAVENDAIHEGKALLDEHLGVAVDLEGGAAMAGLLKAIRGKGINRSEPILLHVTGAGLNASIDENGLGVYPAQACLALDDFERAASLVESYLKDMGAGSRN